MKKIFTLIFALTSLFSVTAQSTKYIKVTTAPADWTGTYLIVYEADDDNNLAYIFDGALEAKALDSKNNFLETSNPKEFINGEEVRVITADYKTDAAIFSITRSVTEGAYNIKSASGYWIGYNNAEKGEPNLEYSNEIPFDNIIEMEEGKTSINIIGKVDNYQLRFNNEEGKMRFRYHELGKKKSVKLYRKAYVPSSIILDVMHQPETKQGYNLQGQPILNSQSKGIKVLNGKVILLQ